MESNTSIKHVVLGDEACPYPHMAAPLAEGGEEVARFGILKHVVPNME
jgi:hypothetical protein